MLGGDEEKDPDAAKKEEERQEALRQEEEERKAKYAKMEAEREAMRQGIRDKVGDGPGPGTPTRGPHPWACGRGARGAARTLPLSPVPSGWPTPGSWGSRGPDLPLGLRGGCSCPPGWRLVRDRPPPREATPVLPGESGGRGLRPGGWGGGGLRLDSSGSPPAPENGVWRASRLLNREDETRVTARPVCPVQRWATGGQCPRGEPLPVLRCPCSGQGGGSLREGQPASNLAPGASAPAHPGAEGAPGGRRREEAGPRVGAPQHEHWRGRVCTPSHVASQGPYGHSIRGAWPEPTRAPT